MSERVRRLSENTYVRFGWAVTILLSCIGTCAYTAYCAGQITENVKQHTSQLAAHDALFDDHGKRLTQVEIWAKIHEVKDTAQ